jgi:hypothetical protein
VTTTPQTIAVVSGLPRSGTSMMMRALQAGGLPALADGLRQADEDNPHGYFELEEVKRTVRDASWIASARGKVVKVIARLLVDLPAGERYKIVFMRRDLDEVLRSQRKMLERRGEPDGPPDEEMRRLLLGHVLETEDWLRARPEMETLYVSYNRMVADPRPQAERINRFFGGALDLERMVAAVDASLYRQRKED